MAATSGQKTVTTAGTAVALGSAVVNGPLMIKALDTNTGIIAVGNDGAGDVTVSNGMRLEAGDAIIFDLKYGRGVRVGAENNPQLAFYARGAFRAYELEKIEAVIVQRRVVDGITSTVWDKDAMDNWENDFRQAVKATRLPNAPLVQGDHCRWCPALGVCPAQLDDFNSLDEERDVSVMSNEDIGHVLAKADLLRSSRRHLLASF